jgi:hypothetical protein
MPAFFTAHAVRHALASAALALGLLIGSAAAAGAQQTTDRADTLSRLRGASTTHAYQVDAACVVQVTLAHDMTPYAVWQCATAWATAYNASTAACATAARWLAAPGHIGFMGLAYVSCDPTTGAAADHTTTEAQRQLLMEREDYYAWRRLWLSETPRVAARCAVQPEC